MVDPVRTRFQRVSYGSKRSRVIAICLISGRFLRALAVSWAMAPVSCVILAKTLGCLARVQPCADARATEYPTIFAASAEGTPQTFPADPRSADAQSWRAGDS